MMNMVSDYYFDSGLLNEFAEALKCEGFSALPDAELSIWQGPIHPSFKPFTDADTMIVRLARGWPYVPPEVFVDGLHTSHVTAGGFVCLWREGDASFAWRTVDDLISRIEEWCRNAESGWRDDALAEDAYLNYSPKLGLVVTFDFPEFRIKPGGYGDFYAKRLLGGRRVHLIPKYVREPQLLRGLWLHANTLKFHPPRNFKEVFDHLSDRQKKALRTGIGSRKSEEKLKPSGGVDLVMFCWSRAGKMDLLVIACEGVRGKMGSSPVLIPGEIDHQTLMLRSGPDALELQSKRVALFGAGALGGHVAVLLAESGVNSLTVVDNDYLLPGNVVRHVAGHSLVGCNKLEAIEILVKDHAPWVEVRLQHGHSQSPSDIVNAINGCDLVVDATGNDAFSPALAWLTSQHNIPLVSGALYRGGSIGRVRRQLSSRDTPINDREMPKYPPVPIGSYEEEVAVPALGCSAPVNNAPPTSVTACASLIAQVALDALTDRFEFGDEVIDVYRTLDIPPFDRLGRVWVKSPDVV